MSKNLIKLGGFPVLMFALIYEIINLIFFKNIGLQVLPEHNLISFNYLAFVWAFVYAFLCVCACICVYVCVFVFVGVGVCFHWTKLCSW